MYNDFYLWLDKKLPNFIKKLKKKLTSLIDKNLST